MRIRNVGKSKFQVPAPSYPVNGKFVDVRPGDEIEVHDGSHDIIKGLVKHYPKDFIAVSEKVGKVVAVSDAPSAEQLKEDADEKAAADAEKASKKADREAKKKAAEEKFKKNKAAAAALDGKNKDAPQSEAPALGADAADLDEDAQEL